jgi:plastocyanin
VSPVRATTARPQPTIDHHHYEARETKEIKMSVRPTITFGICVAAGIAAGIGLARPGDIGSAAPADQAITAAQQEQAATPAAPGYGGTTPQGAPTDTVQAGAGQIEPAQAAPAAVTIADFDFGAPITVAAGSTVEVTNADGAGHTLTAEGGAFDTGTISGGGTTSFSAPAEPGSYTFFCSIHPSMRGAISVTG